MPKREKIEFIHRMALDQYQGYLSQLDNVNGLGIVEMDNGDTDDPQAVKMALAVYVSRKLADIDLKPEQRIPKSVVVAVNDKTYTVKTTVIEEPDMAFEESEFSSDDL